MDNNNISCCKDAENNPCCCNSAVLNSDEMCVCRTKHRDNSEKRELINRLSRIEGQVRGIKNMIENDAYCTDVLIQTAAASSALGSFNRVLLTSHIKTCVAENIRNGNDEIIDELTGLLQKLMK